MEPYIFEVMGPGFLNQVPTLFKPEKTMDPICQFHVTQGGSKPVIIALEVYTPFFKHGLAVYAGSEARGQSLPQYTLPKP